MSKAKTRRFLTLDQHIDFGGGRIIKPNTKVEVKVKDKDELAVWEHLMESKAAIEIIEEMPEEAEELAEDSEPPPEEPDDAVELAEEFEPLPEEPDDTD